MSSPFFPYQTVSSFFEEHGDFPENLEPDGDDDDVEALDDVEIDPCCYNSYRNFGGGQGEHEWGCPNY